MDKLLRVEYLTRPGLSAASMSVPPGSCVCISGASGSGKSLLLRSIADLDENEGTVFLDGRQRSDIPAPEWRRMAIYVPAESGWWRERVGDHFDDPADTAGILHRLGMPADCMDWPVARLSTGERQRLALVRALRLAPKILLLDEPTSGLDEETMLRVEAILHEKLAGGAGIVLVSHDNAQRERMAMRHFVMRHGTLTEQESNTPESPRS